MIERDIDKEQSVEITSTAKQVIKVIEINAPSQQALQNLAAKLVEISRKGGCC